MGWTAMGRYTWKGRTALLSRRSWVRSPPPLPKVFLSLLSLPPETHVFFSLKGLTFGPKLAPHFTHRCPGRLSKIEFSNSGQPTPSVHAIASSGGAGRFRFHS